MTGPDKFSLKKPSLVLLTIAFCASLTLKSEARRTISPEIYSTLTTEATGPSKKDTVPARVSPDSSLLRRDTLPGGQRVDTFSLKLSKDSLEGPVNYEAEDSAVLLVKEQRFLLYGKAKTTYKDITLTAPRMYIDQGSNIMTAVNDLDSLGQVLTRARFEQGENKFESDTIRFNFKTQQGLTRNTYTQQDEMFVQGRTIKKVGNDVLFIQEGYITTCNLDEPHFAFKTNRLKVVNNKVAVSGPTHPEFEGVPVPIYLPFGFFPLKRGRHSGLLQPEFTTNEDFGLGLTGLGYYHVLNEYLDVRVGGDIYSYGGWSANINPTYRKRYRYNGSLGFNIQHSKLNFKGDPDYSLIKTFNVNWSHSVDHRARPGTTFTASVNAGSSRYNELIPNNPIRNYQNQSSSISYSKTWAGKPYSLSLAANQSTSNGEHLMTLQLPQANFAVTTIYPLQRKEPIGPARWYEKLGVGYNGTFTNNIAFYDTVENVLGKILDTLQWGARHSVPISLSLPPLGPFMVSPFVSYEEQWLQKKIFREWDTAKGRVDTVSIQNGFFADRRVSTGISLNTALFGTYNFRSERLIALRHVVRPVVSINYTPDLSSKHYEQVQINKDGKTDWLNTFEANTLNRGYSRGRFGGMTFGIDNNLEMKVRNKKTDDGTIADSTVQVPEDDENNTKVIRLIDRFGVTSAYNFLADEFKLQPFNFYLSSSLFDKINLTASAVVDPYDIDASTGLRTNRFVWQEGRFRPGRFVTGSVALTTRFQSKPRDPDKEPVPSPLDPINGMDPVNDNYDPMLYQDQQNMMDYMRRNPAEFVDFNIPWSIDLSYSLSISQQRRPDYSGFDVITNQNLSFNTSFSLTPKWNFTTNGYFDVDGRELTMFTMAINRDMHCWQMSINVTPVGNFRSFSFTISPKSSLLQDLRVNRTRTFHEF